MKADRKRVVSFTYDLTGLTYEEADALLDVLQGHLREARPELPPSEKRKALSKITKVLSDCLEDEDEEPEV